MNRLETNKTNRIWSTHICDKLCGTGCWGCHFDSIVKIVWGHQSRFQVYFRYKKKTELTKTEDNKNDKYGPTELPSKKIWSRSTSIRTNLCLPIWQKFYYETYPCQKVPKEPKRNPELDSGQKVEKILPSPKSFTTLISQNMDFSYLFPSSTLFSLQSDFPNALSSRAPFDPGTRWLLIEVQL